jgi:hypothetical protein
MLPERNDLQQICKALAVLDAILCSEWEDRFYSYNSKWGANEECFMMRNGQGDELFILFKGNQCVVNGYLHEIGDTDIEKSKAEIPMIFYDFIFGEPICSIGTTFCLWIDETGAWQPQNFEKTMSEVEVDFLAIYGKNPQKYLDFASDYYEVDSISYEAVGQVYQMQLLTKETVTAINVEIEDWNQLESDLEEIGYPFHFEN